MYSKLACICKFHIVPCPRLMNGKMNSPWLKAQVYPIPDNLEDLLLLTGLHLTFGVIFRTYGVELPHTCAGHPKGRETWAGKGALMPPFLRQGSPPLYIPDIHMPFEGEGVMDNEGRYLFAFLSGISAGHLCYLCVLHKGGIRPC